MDAGIVTNRRNGLGTGRCSQVGRDQRRIAARRRRAVVALTRTLNRALSESQRRVRIRASRTLPPRGPRAASAARTAVQRLHERCPVAPIPAS